MTSVDEARGVVGRAAEALPGWSAIGPAERRRILLSAADRLEELAPEFAETMKTETGATAGWVSFNLGLGADMIREAAALTTQVNGEVIPSEVPGLLAMGIRRPAGVVLAIAPWNAPIILGVRAIATPLACGNTVVLKGSELCPRTHSLVARAFEGLPENVVGYLTNDPADAPEVVAALIAHPAVRRVNFTGSTKVGKVIAKACAEELKPAVLELGGKAPMVVLDDADLPAAVDAAIFGCFANSGQICMSTERLIVDSALADDFADAFAARAAALPVGDPSDRPTGVLGPVVNLDSVARCNELVEDALAGGAKLLCGGVAETTLMAPTVLDRVTPRMRIFREETFGPLKCIVRVDGVEEAIAAANDSEYGLSASVFGRDLGRAYQVAERIESGICHVNGPTVHDEAQMPFGGVKGSGLGRFGGQAGIAEFTDLRWLTVQTTPRDYPSPV